MGKTDFSNRPQLLPDEDEMRLPPRRVIHGSDTGKLTKVFHASLVVLLVLLAAGIMIWYQWYEKETPAALPVRLPAMTGHGGEQLRTQ